MRRFSGASCLPGPDILPDVARDGPEFAISSRMAAEEAVANVQSSFMNAFFSGDRNACDALLASDFSALRPDGAHTVQVVLRDQWLEEMAGQALEHVNVTDTVISAHGDIAIATVLWVENPESGPVHRCETNVWTRSPDGGWLMAERHTAWCDAGS